MNAAIADSGSLMRFAYPILACMTVGASTEYAAAQAVGLRGITFVVDTSPELTPQGPGAVKPLGLQITYVATRGRIDVRERPRDPF